MAGKEKLITGALEGLADVAKDVPDIWDRTKTLTERALAALRKQPELLDTVKVDKTYASDEVIDEVGEILEISKDGNYATVAFPKVGMKYNHHISDLFPVTDNPDLNWTIEDMWSDFNRGEFGDTFD